MFFSILNRMILWELTKVFSLSLLGITGILLMAGIVSEASQQGLGPAQVLEAIPLLIPSTLPYTIPATTLFACCLVYGRLAHDNEILAIKAAGVNISRVVWPGILLGLIMSIVTMGLYYRIIPYTHLLMRSLIFSDMEDFLYGMLKKNREIDNPRLNYVMYVQRVQGKRLLGATFKRRDAKGHFDVVAQAREAELHVDKARGQLQVHMWHGQFHSEGGTQGTFDDKDWWVPLPTAFGNDAARRPRDMTWKEILRRQREVIHLEEMIATDIALTVSQLMTNQFPADLPKHKKQLEEKLHYTHLEWLSLDAELWMRPVLSLGCLCFVLVGCPVGIWLSRSDYLSAFITCFMPIVFIYYPLLLCGTNMAKEGKGVPGLTIGAANILMGLTGLVLFRRLQKN